MLRALLLLWQVGTTTSQPPTRIKAPPPRATPTQSQIPQSPAPPRNSARNLRHRVVVVDAGHGGPDNGMSGPLGVAKKVREKDITLAIALQLQKALEERGVSVVMTRVRDTLIALHDRGTIANTAKGDLFISVHVNAANPRWNQPASARGFETYFLAEAKTEDEKRVEAMENESIRFETSAATDKDDPLGFIIRDMAQNEHLRESSLLATLVQTQLKGIHPGPSRGIRQAGFSVLVRAFMPAVLVEVGFGFQSSRIGLHDQSRPAKRNGGRHCRSGRCVPHAVREESGSRHTVSVAAANCPVLDS